MAVRQIDLANRWGLARARINAMVAAGMPLSSVEDAEAWRASRAGAVGNLNRRLEEQAVAGAGEVSSEPGATGTVGAEDAPRLPVKNADAIADALEKQRRLVDFTRSEWLRSLRSNPPAPDSSKRFTAYDKSLSMLLRIEKEATARALASRQLITRATSLERFRKVLGGVRSELENAEFEFAPKANPNDPALALKAFRDFRATVLARLYSEAKDATESLFGEDLGDAPEKSDEPEKQDEPAPLPEEEEGEAPGLE
jgi:hypothetical protein